MSTSSCIESLTLMLKRMKKIYDIEFHEVDNEWNLCKERFYHISSNENEVNLVTKQLSVSMSGYSLLECTQAFNIRWDDDNLGIVIPAGKRTIQYRNIVGTISKVNNKYFFLLRRTNCYA